MTQSIFNKTIHTSETSNISDNKPNISDGQQSQRSFGVRVASVVFMVIPHIVTHICSGATKGIDVGGAGPAQFLLKHANKTGEPHSTRRNLCIGASVFVGSIVGVVAVVPSLLIGAVVGIAKSIYKFPDAVKTCWGDGFSTALRKTISSYKINIMNLQIFGHTVANIVGIMALVAVAVGLIILLEYVAIPIFLFCIVMTIISMCTDSKEELMARREKEWKRREALKLEEPYKTEETYKTEEPYKTEKTEEPWEVRRKKAEEKSISAFDILNSLSPANRWNLAINGWPSY